MQNAKMTQKSPSVHHRTTLSSYIFATKAYTGTDNIGKKLVKQQYLVHMSSQYGERLFSNSWDRFGSLGHPSKFQRVSSLGFVTAPTSLDGRQPNFARYSAVFWVGTVYIHFLGLLSPGRILPRAKIDFASKSRVLLYWKRYCTALEQWAWAKLCRVVQGMELRTFCSSSFSTEGASKNIPRAALTLATGPHSSDFLWFLVVWYSHCVVLTNRINRNILY